MNDSDRRVSRSRVWRLGWEILIFLILGVGLMVAASHRWEAASNVLEVSKIHFQFDPRLGTIDDVPTSLREMDGRRITVVGWPYCGFAARDHYQPGDGVQIVSPMKLYPELSGPPRVQQRVFAIAVPGPAGQAAGDMLLSDEFGGLDDVTGVFHVQIHHNSEGQIDSLFRLDFDQAKVHHELPPAATPWRTIAAWPVGIACFLAALVLVVRLLVELQRRRLAYLSL